MGSLRECWNKLNLQPKSKRLQTIFYQFRSRDVAGMAKYFILTSGAYFALALYHYSESPSMAAFLQLIPYFIVFALRILVFVLRERFVYQLGYFFLAI